MSYTLQTVGDKQALLKDGVSVASLDPSAVNLPIVLDDSIAPDKFDALVALWAESLNYNDYIHQLYELDKSNSDEIDFPMFDGWDVPVTPTSFVVSKMKELLSSMTNKYNKKIEAEKINPIV